MVNVMDLRLGNKVYITPLGVNTVYEIGSLDFSPKTCENYNPIPLTPEILEKCGFINDNGAWWTLKLPLPEGFTYPDGYWNFSYCQGVLFINSYSGGGFSIEDAVEIMKEENKKGHNITASSFDLNIENKILPPNKYKYLHQLQNLYWCLCGEELQIKTLTNE